jgi:hypothetical protein
VFPKRKQPQLKTNYFQIGNSRKEQKGKRNEDIRNVRM